MVRYILLVAALAVFAGGARAQAAASFPCRWNYDLEVGLRPGYVIAGENTACVGRSGSLTLSAQLYSWDYKAKRWHLDRTQTRTWADPNGRRYVELQEKCRPGKVRADFHWLLRDGGGSVVASKVIHTPSVAVPAVDCHIVLR